MHQNTTIMKYFFIAFFLFNIFGLKAQNPCEFSANIVDSIGSYKNTRDYLVYERNFAGNSSYMYFSLALTDGLPTLNMQSIVKSKDFIKANCLDKNSRIYLQLNSGKIVTLLHIDQENCGSSVRNEEGFNNRILQGIFMFTKDSFEELRKSPISIMRIKYATETVDYVLKSELKSEMDGKSYQPESYFINTIHCLEE